MNEVALAVQLDRPAVDLEVLGLFAGKVKAEFPEQQAQAPLPPMEEVDKPSPPQIELTLGAQTPRMWFLTPDAHGLIQLQSDRLVLNWRRLGGDQEYPRYVALREQMAGLLDILGQVIEAAGKPPAAVNFCELTYINEIVVPGTEPGSPHPQLDAVIEGVRPSKGAFLEDPEDAQLQVRWRIPPDRLPGGCSIGRLYAMTAPAFRADTQLPIYAMNLTGRIACPGGIALAAGLSTLDVAHDWIVRGFADLTTEAMHAEWKRRG